MRGEITMKKKLLLIMAIMSFTISGCDGKGEIPNAETASTLESTSVETETQQSVSQEKAEAELPDSLEEYLSKYQDSATHHLLYDYALNENADGSPSDGINYMFMKDSEGKRITGSIMAFYTNPNVSAKDDNKSYVDSFIESYFPELVPVANMAQDTAAEDHWIRAYYFDDYGILFMPEPGLDGITVVISKSE